MQKRSSIALLTGGPSLERGISLNSARSVLDHLQDDRIEIVPFYVDQKRQAYELQPAQMYSNTPSDFDFKLARTKKPLSERSLVKKLKACDLAFPVIHGQYGEDGVLQSFLEKNKIPFIGSPSEACKQCFDKYKANRFIRENGFYTVPSEVLGIYKKDHKQKIDRFFKEHRISQAVVKPAAGGSSIGVFTASSPKEALEHAKTLFSKRMDTRVVVEPLVRGMEFTVIILQNRFGLPVALIPSEIEQDYEEHQLFDYRRKYLPTRQVTFHCPPRFSDTTIEQIRVMAEQLFVLFGMKDFARFDGWVLPDEKIWFSDFNPASGMEQNSFLFQQGARVGLTHRGILRYVADSAARRYAITLPSPSQTKTKRKEIPVLFGGPTSERQVSLMSGTNVWLKLRRSKQYSPEPYLLSTDGTVLHVPYALLLNHTVDEIIDACERAHTDDGRLARFAESTRLKLATEPHIEIEEYFTPMTHTLKEFLKGKSYIFLGLHGGDGESGVLQARLEKLGIRFNGCGSSASALCMDKYETAQALADLEDHGISCAPKFIGKPKELTKKTGKQLNKVWQEITSTLKAQSVVVKPLADGCSSGVVHLASGSDFQTYLKFLAARVPRLASGTLEKQLNPVEMPVQVPEKLMFEPFIETDKIRAVGSELKIQKRNGWIEITVGVLEENGTLRSLNPSITVAEGEVLTVEEKFQGGTGINITPPPREILTPAICKKVQRKIELVAKTLGIKNYARIDAFVERKTGRIMVIEANSLPALTPSTVLFHQALAEKEQLFPVEFLEKIVRGSDCKE